MLVKNGIGKHIKETLNAVLKQTQINNAGTARTTSFLILARKLCKEQSTARDCSLHLGNISLAPSQLPRQSGKTVTPHCPAEPGLNAVPTLHPWPPSLSCLAEVGKLQQDFRLHHLQHACASYSRISPQHQRSHQDPAALRFNFYQVITCGPWAPPQIRALQRRCLAPGWYALHIHRWLSHFPASQVRACPAHPACSCSLTPCGKRFSQRSF